MLEAESFPDRIAQSGNKLSPLAKKDENNRKIFYFVTIVIDVSSFYGYYFNSTIRKLGKITYRLISF